MKSASANRSANALAVWLFALTLIGYPFFGLLAALLNSDSLLTSIPFRLAVLVLAFFLMLQVVPRTVRITAGPILLWIFLGLYFWRLVWDASIIGLQSAPGALVFFIACTVIPCLALARTDMTPLEFPLARLLYRIGGVTCLLALVMHVFHLGESRSLTDETGRLSYDALNPISLGHVAVTTLIAIYSMSRYHLSPARRLAQILVAVAAIGCLVLTASRGPALALAISTIVFIVASGRWRWMFALALLVMPVLLNDASQFQARFSDIAYDESINERLTIQKGAWNDFQQNPVAGNAFVETSTATYPHNLFVEAAMALGVVGVVVVMLLMVCCCAGFMHNIRRHQLLIPLLLVQYGIAAQLSGSIYGNSALWAAILVSFHVYRRRSVHRRPSLLAQARSGTVAI